MVERINQCVFVCALTVTELISRFVADMAIRFGILLNEEKREMTVCGHFSDCFRSVSDCFTTSVRYYAALLPRSDQPDSTIGNIGRFVKTDKNALILSAFLYKL